MLMQSDTLDFDMPPTIRLSKKTRNTVDTDHMPYDSNVPNFQKQKAWVSDNCMNTLTSIVYQCQKQNNLAAIHVRQCACERRRQELQERKQRANYTAK